MTGICSSVEELIGGTPLVELSRLARAHCPEVRLLAKPEYRNPAGSVKDRVAAAMLTAARQEGLLAPGGTVVEPTSGSTGVALAALAAVRGYRAVIVMPDSMSVERRRLVEAYGGQVVLTPGRLGMAGAIEKARQLAGILPGAYMPDQFSNPANPAIHFETTGPELWRAAGGRIDWFIAGVGTGGTLTGAGRFLRIKDPNICLAAVEPAGSPVLSGGRAGPHGIEGLGAGFVPAVMDVSLPDEIVPVADEDAFAMAREAGLREGLPVGISSGAALWAAVQIGRRPENKGKTLAVLLPDGVDRYLSTGLFQK